MPVLAMGELVASDVAALDLARTCVVLAVSPIEEHGPHLPLATDVLESEGMARRLCARLEGEPKLAGWTYLFYPALPIGCDTWRYPGSVEVRATTVQRVVEDIGLSLAEQGFRRILIANNHGGPRHNLALDAAARTIERRSRARALSIAGRVMVDLLLEGGLDGFFARHGLAARKGDLRYDFHAGFFETSEMLALFPELVRAGWEKLVPVIVPFRAMRRDSALTAGAGQGYFGAPALASRELGEAYVTYVLERLHGDVVRFLEGERVAGLSLRWRLGLGALAGWAEVRERASGLSRRARRAPPAPRRRAPQP
jgi:creatinine amidohydrolase